MEGRDGSPHGKPTDLVLRPWTTLASLGLRAYPKTPARRQQMIAHAKASKPWELATFFSNRTSSLRYRVSQEWQASTTQRRARLRGARRGAGGAPR